MSNETQVEAQVDVNAMGEEVELEEMDFELKELPSAPFALVQYEAPLP